MTKLTRRVASNRSFPKLFSLSGKVAVVTGGSGQLGGEYVRTLLDAGALVVAFDIDPASPKGRLGDVRTKRLLTVRVDIRDARSIEKGLKRVVSKLGNPSVLINNAAIDVPPGAAGRDTGPFESYPESSWRRIMDVNLKGTFLCCQIIGSHMARHGGGSIINISSIYGMLSPDQRIYAYRSEKKPFFKPAAYGVTKAGVASLTRYLATYWAGSNVRVNTLTLGGVYNRQDETFVKNYSQKVPLGRMANQHEYNGAVLFLASDASSYMTGSNLVIDGGFSSW
jgi:NAD(P)-dependent dehydrogenase (short-subunit alcohol dehydrogenase family)